MASKKALNQCLVLPILLMNFVVLLGQCARPLNTEEGEDLVTATCKHTFHFELCISTLRSVPASRTSDLKVLAEIALTLSTTYAADTLSYVHVLQSNSSAVNYGSNNNIYASRCLSDCAEEYSEAIENLKDSKEALADGDCDQSKWTRWFLLLCLMLRHVRMASRTCKVRTVILPLLLLRGIVAFLNSVAMLLPLQSY